VTHTSVITLRNDVGQAIVDDDLDLNIRIFPQEFCKLWPEDRIHRMVDGRDPNGAGGLLPEFTQGLKLGLDLLKPWANGVTQAFACFRWRDAARGAGQEPKSQPSFEFADGVAERRLGNAQLRCCFRETAFSPYGQKRQEIVRIFALYLWPLLKVDADYSG
jgi:hypothetical protein